MGYTRTNPSIRHPMLSFHAAPRHARETSEAPRIGLAVAGGGPIGGMYELGVPRALDEALVGLDFNSTNAGLQPTSHARRA